MLSSSNRCNCQIGSGIPIGSNWAIMDVGMTERCRMPMAWETDRSRAFVGRAPYPSYPWTINGLNDNGKNMLAHAHRCIHVSRHNAKSKFLRQ